MAILAVAAAFLLGYQAGQRSVTPALISPAPPVDSSEPTPAPPQEPPPSTAKGDPDPLPPITPPVTPPADPVDEEAPSPAKSALTAFLTAPDWSSRSVHVLKPGKVVLQMKTMAQQEGDGPIPYSKIMSVGLNQPNTQVFDVTIERYPKGVPVTLRKIGNQWLVDWSPFAEFYYDAFRQFSSGPTGLSGTFHLHLLPHPDQPNRFTLSPPTGGDGLEAQSKPDSSAHKRITSILNFYAESSPDQYQLALKHGGPPFILKIARLTVNGQKALVIQEVIETE